LFFFFHKRIASALAVSPVSSPFPSKAEGESKSVFLVASVMDQPGQHRLTRIFLATFATVCLGCGAIMLWVGTQGNASVKDTGHYFGAASAFAIGIFALLAVYWDMKRVGNLLVPIRGSFSAK
jgi:hypothetical protein